MANILSPIFPMMSNVFDDDDKGDDDDDDDDDDADNGPTQVSKHRSMSTSGHHCYACYHIPNCFCTIQPSLSDCITRQGICIQASPHAERLQHL